MNLAELLGHPDAEAFCRDVLDVVAIYDDLIDKDKPIADRDIHRAMWLALVDMPRNPFYRAHFDLLNPLVIQAIVNWRAANRLETTGNASAVSFVIRSTYADIISMCATILHGPAVSETLAIRTFIHDEGIDQYQQEMRNGMRQQQSDNQE